MNISAKSIRERKSKGKAIVCLTAYDHPIARLLDEIGVDIVLVGDSLGTVLLGYDSTCSVTMREMLHHTKAVSRAVKNSLIVSDMPFGSYESSYEKAVRNAERLIKEGGAQAVKLEGGVSMAKTVAAMTQRGIAVMGHVGLTPQSAQSLGGYKVQGKTPEEAARVLSDALALDQAGCFAIVLECVPADLAKRITNKVSVPTIGIGAGPDCDGQILVTHDLLGFTNSPKPKFVRTYADLHTVMKKAVTQFKKDVIVGKYPSAKESYGAAKKVSMRPVHV